MTLDLDALDGVFAPPRRARPSPGAAVYQREALEDANAAFVLLPPEPVPTVDDTLPIEAFAADAPPPVVAAAPVTPVPAATVPAPVTPATAANPTPPRHIPWRTLGLAGAALLVVGAVAVGTIGNIAAPRSQTGASTDASAKIPTGADLPVAQDRREPGPTAGAADAPTRLATLPAHREVGAPSPPTQPWVVPFVWDQVDPGPLTPPASLRACRHLRVTGHTCSLGQPEANRVIGLARAAAVRDALVAAGIPAEIISLDSAGESAPVASNATADGRARNRRVETTCTQETP